MKCLFVHDWVYHDEQKGSTIFDGEKIEILFHQFRVCDKCGVVEKAMNPIIKTRTGPKGNCTFRQIVADWVRIPKNEFVARKI